MPPSRSDTITKAYNILKNEADVVERLRETMPESLKVLSDIACGNPPRGSAAILKAIELQLRFTQPLPKQTIEHQGAVGIAIVDPYAVAPATVEGELVEEALPEPADLPRVGPATSASPGAQAVPPVIRRKESP